MKRLIFAAMAVLAVATAGSAEPIKPAVEVRMKAAKELVPILEYGGALFGQEDAGKQFAGILKQFADDPKGFEGVDLNRPIGVYVGVSEKVEDSPVVVMVPVADEKAVLAAMAEKLMLDPKKGDGGLYTTDVPGLPGSVHFRFADKYAYITIRSEKGIDPTKLIAPKDFFAEKPAGFVSAVVHISRWPADVKQTIWGQLEMGLKENNSKLAATPVQKLFNDFLADVTVDAAKTALTDGDKFTLTLDVDPKSDDWKFAVGLTAKPNTTLAKTLAGFADRESVAAGMANTAGPFGGLVLNLQLPPETKKKLAAVADKVAILSIGDAEGNDKIGAQLFADAVLPTVKSGDFQLGLLTTPAATSGGKLGMMLAMKTVDGKKVETVAKLGALAIPKDQGAFEGDVAEVGGRKLHKLTRTNELDAPFAFGTVWVMTSDDLIGAAADPKADSLKALSASKGAKTPMFAAEMSFARAAPLFEKEQKPEVIQKVIKDVFGDGKVDGRDTLKILARGGEKFELTVSMKGKAIALMAALDKAKKGE